LAPAVAAGEGGNLASLLRELPGMLKLRIGVFMTLTALAAMVATPGATPGPWEAAALALSILLAAGGAGGFNQFYEAELDRNMPRTRQRPFASGRLARHPAWLVFFLTLLVVGVALAAVVVNPICAAWVFLGAFFYAVVYTIWLKRRTWINIVIGGASGSFAVLAGAAAVDPFPGAIPVLLALALFFWTPSHFWSLAIAKNRDYSRSGVPMLPVIVGNQKAARIVLVNTIVLVGFSVAPFFLGMGWVYLACNLLGGGFFLYHNLRMLADPSPGIAMKSFFASLLQLVLLLTGAVAGGLLAA
jgi:protoheme IX farnesyltransferase